MYKKCLILLILGLLIIGKVFTEEISFTLEIQGITIDGKTIHGGIYSINTYGKNNPPEYSFQGIPVNNTLSLTLDIQKGDYVIQIYQDTNDNGRLDSNLFGIPKEPIGISNWDGKGIPGNFNRHKITINDGYNIIVQLNAR